MKYVHTQIVIPPPPDDGWFKKLIKFIQKITKIFFNQHIITLIIQLIATVGGGVILYNITTNKTPTIDHSGAFKTNDLPRLSIDSSKTISAEPSKNALKPKSKKKKTNRKKGNAPALQTKQQPDLKPDSVSPLKPAKLQPRTRPAPALAPKSNASEIILRKEAEDNYQ